MASSMRSKIRSSKSKGRLLPPVRGSTEGDDVISSLYNNPRHRPPPQQQQKWNGTVLPFLLGMTFMASLNVSFSGSASIGRWLISYESFQNARLQTEEVVSASTSSHSSTSSSSGNTFQTQVDNDAHMLEDMFYKYKSDKSHDDHKYSDLYQMLFRPIRNDVRNVTEIGVAAGQSLQVWYRFFPNAHIRGYDTYDISAVPSMQKIVEAMGDRIHFVGTDRLLQLRPDQLREEMGLVDESMDILIEDAMHTPDQQEAFLNLLWRLVKPGGYYIIEDLRMINDKKASGSSLRFWTTPEELKPSTVHLITNEFDTVLVDTTIGHRNFDEWKRRSRHWARGRPEHNSWALVLRRRTKPLPEAVQMHFGESAMNSNEVVID